MSRLIDKQPNYKTHHWVRMASKSLWSILKQFRHVSHQASCGKRYLKKFQDLKVSHRRVSGGRGVPWRGRTIGVVGEGVPGPLRIGTGTRLEGNRGAISCSH